MPEFQHHITADDGGKFGVYISRPTQANGHAIVFLQEIFGVTAPVRAAADRLAEAGYLVYVPDMFWRLAPGLELSHSQDDIQKALGYMGRFDQEAGLADIATTARNIRQSAGFSGKVAVSGLCLGGLLTYLACTRPGFDAGVAFYGVGIEKQLNHLANLQCPLMLHFGRQDAFVPTDAQQKIEQAMARDDRIELHFYEGADHGFYTRGKADDIHTAHQRTLDFLNRVLNA